MFVVTVAYTASHTLNTILRMRSILVFYRHVAQDGGVFELSVFCNWLFSPIVKLLVLQKMQKSSH